MLTGEVLPPQLHIKVFSRLSSEISYSNLE